MFMAFSGADVELFVQGRGPINKPVEEIESLPPLPRSAAPSNAPEDTFKRELHKWVFGSDDFLRQMVALAEGSDRNRHQSTSRRLKTVSVTEILSAVALHHEVERAAYIVH